MTLPAWKKTLDAAAGGDGAALLRVARHVTTLLDGMGAYGLRGDWAAATQDIVQETLRRWKESRGTGEADRLVESVTRNRFWGFVLAAMDAGSDKAANLFFPTVRRLVARWDGSRAQEASWDDIAQETAHQLWQRWQRGDVESPWALLCTIARRRYLDRVRAARPTEEVPEDVDDPGAIESGGSFFATQALAVVEEEERRIIVAMDLEGRTRREVAEALGKTEGEVLAVRRAGLRKIWRWLGRDLPPAHRRVWEDAFKGSKRRSPEELAERLELPDEEVRTLLREARMLTGTA